MAGQGQKPRGQIREYRSPTGVLTYTLRVRLGGRRVNIRLGSELEGWNRPLAERSLQRTLREIEAGIWRPPVEDPDPEADPVFHEFATFWIDRQTVGAAPSTVRNYSRILSRYLLPEFKDQRLTEITHEAVRRWRDRLRQEADRLQVAKENGVTLLDRRGEAIRPFGASTINEALRLLGQILERAVESEHYAVQRNPVKGRTGGRHRRRRSGATKPDACGQGTSAARPRTDLVAGRRRPWLRRDDRDLHIPRQATQQGATETPSDDRRARADRSTRVGTDDSRVGASRPHPWPAGHRRFKNRGRHPRDLPLAVRARRTRPIPRVPATPAVA